VVLELLAVLLWWAIGFVLIAWSWTKDFDLEIQDAVVFSFIALGGPVTGGFIALITALEHREGSVVLIRKRG
jgi:hypothetical protein